MRIIVTHVSKQYVNQLLIALHQYKLLHRYYTSFASNKWINLFSSNVAITNQLKKRLYAHIPAELISSFVPAFILEKWNQNTYWIIKNSSRLFDFWVSRKLTHESYDMIIGYENANLQTFKKAKASCKITVLDLAQIHHNTIAQINKSFRLDTLTDTQTAYIDQRKECALTYTDYILTLSSLATDSLVKNGFSRDRIYKVSLGIQLNLFTPVKKNTYGTLKLLFVGAIMERKGIYVLLNAFASLIDLDIELTIIGPPGDAQSALNDHSDKISYVPYTHHEQLVHYYQQAHVFVFPSLLDSWAQVVLEAMACATPVLITDHTGAKDAVEKGGGFVIKSGSAEALVEKIMFFYTNRAAIEELGAEARKIAEQYSWEHYHQQIIAAVQSIGSREGIALE